MAVTRLSPSRRREDIRAWWAAHLEAQRRSGQSQVAYCRSQGIEMYATRRLCCRRRMNLPARTSPTWADALFNNLAYAQSICKTRIIGRHKESMNHFRRMLSVWWVILTVGWTSAAVVGPTEDLLNAASRGDATSVQALLAKGADVNAKGLSGDTALIAASRNGHLDVVQVLLKQRADINAQVGFSYNWQVPMIDQRPVIDAHGSGDTALMAASEKGYLDVVQVLLSKGADVNAKGTRCGLDRVFMHPHHPGVNLVNNSNYECTDRIEVTATDHYCRWDDTSNYGWTALMAASWNGHLDILQALLAKGAKVNAQTSNGETALVWASKQGYLDVVQMLLSNGADINASVSFGDTALMAASWNGHLDVMQALLLKGAKVNAQTSNGETALMWASEQGPLDVVQMLLSKGADVNAKTRDGWTVLMAATWNGRLDEVQVLLSKGADVNAKTRDGWTALMGASGCYGSLEVVQALLAKGADVNAKTSYGKSALDLATQAEETNISALLMQASAKPKP